MSISLCNLDPWTLPRVKLQEKRLLPDSAGLYFVFCGNELLYIGKTEASFYRRWRQHHRAWQVSQKKGTVYIAYWAVDINGSELARLEREACHIFHPLLNSTTLTYSPA